MEKLPSELLAKILQSVPRYDLPSVRLINQSFSAEAAPFLFDTISLWIELKSVEALTSISEHPRLSKYVRTIAFSPLRFVELCDLSSFTQRWEHCLEAYNSYIAGQRYLASGSLDVKLLSQALSKLPNFKSLILDYQFHGGTLRLYQTFRESQHSCDTITMDGEYSFPVLFTALSNAKAAITALTIRDWYDESFWSDESSMRLPDSDVGGNSPSTSYEIVSRALVKTFYGPHNRGCRTALRELRHFEVDLGNEDDGYDIFDDYDPTEDGDRIFTNTIRDMLKWSSQIESISFPQTMQNSLSLKDLFPTERLTKLQKVHLWEFKTGLPDLLLFFRCHGRRLKDVQMNRVRLTDADWPTALHCLRSLEFPDLETFFVDHDGYEDNNARDYITGATDINPLDGDTSGD